MSAIDEVIAGLQKVLDELDDATNAAEAARSEADEGLSHAVVAGGGATVAGYEAIKDAIEKLTQQLAAATEIANEAVGHADAVVNGT